MQSSSDLRWTGCFLLLLWQEPQKTSHLEHHLWALLHWNHSSDKFSQGILLSSICQSKYQSLKLHILPVATNCNVSNCKNKFMASVNCTWHGHVYHDRLWCLIINDFSTRITLIQHSKPAVKRSLPLGLKSFFKITELNDKLDYCLLAVVLYHFIFMIHLIKPLIQNIVLSLLQQAETTSDSQIAAKFSQRAKKFGIISIVIWISILVSAPILMVLISYLLTLQDWLRPLQEI